TASSAMISGWPPELRRDHRHEDAEDDRQEERRPRHGNRRKPEQQTYNRRKSEDHDVTLSATSVRVKFGSPSGQVRPDEYHRRAGRRPQLVERATARMEVVKSVDIRGNTDESWRHGLDYMLRHDLFRQS